MAAIAIDYGRTEAQLVRVQNAVDSAALAASHRLGLPDQDAAGPQKADAYFKANLAKHADVGVLDSVTLDAVKGEVAAKVKGNMRAPGNPGSSGWQGRKHRAGVSWPGPHGFSAQPACAASSRT